MQTVTERFMPHGASYLWEPGLLWTHVVADALIAVACLAIPPTLILLVARGRQRAGSQGLGENLIPYPWIAISFAVFILASGLTHVMAVWTVWEPRFWIAGGVKVVTAGASILTAVALPVYAPRLLRLVEAGRVAAAREVEVERLSQELQAAQRLARVGRWWWDEPANRFTLKVDLLGWPEMSQVGGLDEFLAILDEDDRESMRRWLREAVRGTAPATIDIRMPTRDGTRTIEVRAEPDEEPGTVSGTVQDVTEGRRAEEASRNLLVEQMARERAEVEKEALAEQAAELERTAAELARRNRDLDQFAYIASHDLKSPLRAVGSLAGWLVEDVEGLSEEAEEYAHLMVNRVERMRALIDGLLTYARAGRGIGRNVEPVDSGALARQVLAGMDRPEGVEVTVDQDLPDIRADASELRLVFQHLLRNALYHARSWVWVSVESEDRMWRFTVSDDGPGIPEAFHEKVWQIFQRLGARDDLEGTGIGLALVRKIVENAGGEAWIDPAATGGTRVHFTWPALSEEDSLETR